MLGKTNFGRRTDARSREAVRTRKVQKASTSTGFKGPAVGFTNARFGLMPGSIREKEDAVREEYASRRHELEIQSKRYSICRVEMVMFR